MHLNLRPMLPQEPPALRSVNDMPLSMDGQPGRRVAERLAERRRDDAQRRQKPDRRQPERSGEGPLSRAVITLTAALVVLDLAAPTTAASVVDETPEATSFDLLLSQAVG